MIYFFYFLNQIKLLSNSCYFLAVLDFLNDEAIDDAWTLSSYLGDADILLTKLRGMLSTYNEAESVLRSAAASIAVRGVLFGNSHPLSSRLAPISTQSLV